MSRLDTILKKRAFLTQEKHAILEERLRAGHTAIDPGVEEQPLPPGESVADLISGWDLQAPLELDWEALVRAGLEQAQRIPTELNCQDISSRLRLLNKLCTAYICLALRQSGAFTRPGERYSIDKLMTLCHIRPAYRKLIHLWLTMLATDGLLRREGSDFLCPWPLSATMLEETLQEIEADARHEEFHAILRLLNAGGERLADVLTGRRHALQNFFSGGSQEVSDLLEQAAPHATYFDHIARAILEAVGGALPHRQQLRILEIGAGTCSTTASLLPSLLPDQTTYLITDVSSFFLREAEYRLGKYPFVHYLLLDINEDPLQQGYSPHLFDVVIAANVMHCARSTATSLQYVRSLLKPHGLLVMIEMTHMERWYSMCAGPLPGFLNFEDERLAHQHPLLSSSEWEEALRSSGFEKFISLPTRGLPTEVLGQHVILGQP